ncbi:uncharacterized protein LOC129582078 [Paramacrobiotus metropolitanus]|uniref:uncharacterized protein LOC129582078 n=1 Tax=Paramacrobiotus metropolitanus TaxID=2943436 RepID=UPI0024458A3F|nr:uncharacterized protein LOC129582078 [Paramacrobiotus metropolitanus]
MGDHLRLRFMLFCLVAVNVQCAMEASNNITTTLHGELPDSDQFEGFDKLTTSLCADANTDKSANVSHVKDKLQRLVGARSYLNQTDIPADQQDVLFLAQFNGLLALLEHVGLHSLLAYVVNRNFSVCDWEQALNYAWTPSFGKLQLHV